jgi:hypothetical protein
MLSQHLSIQIKLLQQLLQAQLQLSKQHCLAHFHLYGI